MKLEKAIEVLSTHNEWRRGSDQVDMADPKELSEAIDVVVGYCLGTNEIPTKEALEAQVTQVTLPFISGAIDYPYKYPLKEKT